MLIKGDPIIPLLQTKLMPPVIREKLVHRVNLVNLIEKGIEEGFILVSAPPGYGKTLLVADWVNQTTSPVAWLTLDANDNDPLVFNRYLRRMLEKLLPGVEQLENEIPPEANTSETLNLLLSWLINTQASATSDVSLVLDDYQVIDNPEIHQGILFLLEHFPPHLRLILITRVDPPFSLARLRAIDRILEIHAEELAFSLEETSQFLNISRELGLPPERISELFQKTEGWITGLELASLAADKSDMINQPGIAITGNANLTLEYIVDEVINYLPSSTQEFLLRTSVLYNLYGPLCDYVIEPFITGVKSHRLLHELYHANLFLTSLDVEEHWFRYHSLFAESLQHLLTERYPEEVQTLRLRASEWCDQNNLPDAALRYAISANDEERVIDLLEKYALDAIRQNRFMDIISWSRQVDERYLTSSALLSMINSWRYILAFDLDAGRFWLDKSVHLMGSFPLSERITSNADAIWGLIAAGQSIQAAMQGDMNQSLEKAAQALSLLPSENDFAHSFALLNQGLALSLSGEINRAIEVLHEAIRISRNSGNWFVMVVARSNLGEILIDNGQLSQALAVFQQSIQFFTTAPIQFGALEGLIYRQMAEIYLARNELNQAQEYLQKSMAVNHSDMAAINEFDIHLRLATLYSSKGDHVQAQNELVLARELSLTSSSLLDDLILALTDARISLLRGQLSPAQKWEQVLHIDQKFTDSELKGIPPSLQDNIALTTARYSLVRGRLNHDRSQFMAAIAILDGILPSLINGGLVEHQIEANILLALAYNELGEEGKMLEALKAALRIAEPEEFRQVFIDEGIPMSRLLIQLLSHLRQASPSESALPTRAFVSDLLMRLTSGAAETPLPASSESVMEGQEESTFELLTMREKEVLQLVTKGYSNGEIALELHISINTVKRHMNNIFLKLGVTTRTQAVRVALNKRLVR